MLAMTSQPTQPSPSLQPIMWMHTTAPVGYAAAVTFMERRVAAIADGTAHELIWTLTHPPLYTAGTSARPADLLEPDRFPVHVTGRGGQYTYHGHGQLIAYVMLNLKARGGDVRAFVAALEAWLIATLAEFGIIGVVRAGRVGVWVERADAGPREDKIAALGIRVRRGVTYHGISLNVAPDLSHFSGIVACGLSAHGVTSLADLGHSRSLETVERCLQARAAASFGAIQRIG
jgi:lipoyl(octanoyl) transferase